MFRPVRSATSRLVVLVLACCATLALATLSARAGESRLKTIAETGKIRIGYGNAAPFSYIGDKGEVIGYSIDLCRHVVEDLRRDLRLDRLSIEFVMIRPQDRMQTIRDGLVDIECGASTNTPERNRGAAFALSHFFTATRFVSLARNNLTRIADLKGRGVALPLGTTNIADLHKLNRTHKLDLLFVPIDGLREGLALVGSNKVSAYVMDDVLLTAMVAGSPDPAAYQISREEIAGVHPYGFMLPLDDTEMKQAVDASLRKLYTGAEMAEIYDRWFIRPLPALGINMQMPMTETMKKWFANPVSGGIQPSE